MSSPHPPQVKWSPVLLLLLTLVLQFPSPATCGKCEDRCENHRLPGLTAAYTLNCENEYSDSGSINYCKNDCASCSSDICSPYKPGIFHCPAVKPDNKICEQHCNSYRRGSTEDFRLTCSTQYSSPADDLKCRTPCKSCPQEICTNSASNMYRCPTLSGPSPPISGACLARCDNNRPRGTTGAYTLSCIKEYQTLSELLICRRACTNEDCPRSVCWPYNPDIYHCPAKVIPTTPPPISGRCKNRCDHHRPSGTTRPYTLNCENAFEYEDEAEECRRDCLNCYTNNRLDVCNYKTNANIFNCPEIPRPLPPPTPPPPPTYEGECEERCTENRPKGPYGISSEPYTFNCNEEYSSYNDIRYCKRDCRKCPSHICSSSKPELHHCPVHKLQKRCDDICKANRQFGTTEAYTFKCSEKYSTDLEINYCRRYCIDCPSAVCDSGQDNDTYNCPKDRAPHIGGPDTDRWESSGKGQSSTLAIVAIIIVFLIVVVCIGVCIYCCVRKKPMAQTGQYYGASGGGSYPTGGQFVQQQQPYPMNYYAPSQQSTSSISVARSAPSSNFGYAPNYK